MSEAENTPKRRGRPRKAKVESSSPVKSLEISPEKKPRGRPVKYAPEERQEKYKELSKVWREEHKDYVRDWQSSNASKLVDANKRYLDRLRQGYKYLSMLLENDRINFNNDDEKQYVKKLFV
jgi:hypothetical protein